MGTVREVSREVRRPYGTGSVFQRCDHPTCPPTVPGPPNAKGKPTKVRPPHTCKGSWIGRIEAGWDGNNERRRIQVSAKTEGECKRKLIAKRRDIEANGLPTGEVSERTTVKVWTDTWLVQIKKSVRPGVHSDYESAVRRWIVPVLGRKKLTTLTPGDLRELERAQLAVGNASSSARQTHRILMKCLRDALVEGHRIPPRIFAAKKPEASTTDRDRIPMEDAVDLLGAVVQRVDRSRWLAGLMQGLRRGEALGLTLDYLDLKRNTITVEWQLDTLPYLDRAAGTFDIPAGLPARHLWKSFHLVPPKTQNGKRVIPIVPAFRVALEEWLEIRPDSPHGLVWPRENGLPRNKQVDAAEFRALQDVAQIANFDGKEGRRYDGHEMRHTTATLLLEAGVDPEVIKAILGHSSIITSRGYMHVNQDLARKAMESVAERLMLPPT